MAVMTTQPPSSAQEQKQSSAIAPISASAGVGSMTSNEAVVGMDLDTLGSKNESPSANATSPPNEAPSTNGDAHSTIVNGNSKDIAAPPSPPVPTPPLQTSNDNNAHHLSDLHITSPDGSFMPTGDAMNATLDDATDTQMNDVPMNEEQGTNGETQQNGDNDAGKSTTQSQNGPTDSKTEIKEEAPAPVVKEEEMDKPMTDAEPLKKLSRDREEEDGDGEDRPPKRAKTEDASEHHFSNAETSTAQDLTGPLTPARAKFVLGVVRSLRRTKDARPFSMPVDAVKLNVPTYYDIVKNPMDLQTMERKLNQSEYNDVESFVSDFNLILHNCELFNGEGHAVTNLSKVMEASFYKHMSDLPGEDVVEIPKPKSKKKGGSARESTAPASKPEVTKKTAAKTTVKPPAARPKKEAKSTAQSPAAASPVFSLQPSGMPQIRRDSAVGDGRPKREIHPPAPKDLPYSTKPRRKQNAAELKFCDIVLKELYKKVHQDYAFPFYQPVDPVALNIPDYFKIIKRPMDLSTVQEKLKINAYEDANEFEADIRLMFNNCYKFNPEGQTVHIMGRRLESVFDEKWKEKPAYTRNLQGSRSPASHSPPPGDEGDMSEDEEEDEERKGSIEELEKKLETMKEMITAMKKDKKGAGPSKKGGNHGRKGSTATQVSSKNKSGNRRGGKKEIPYISLEQKTELSERINYLPPANMKRALKMIKENMPEVGNDAEIELDIDELDPETLHRLYQYVSKHAPPVPQSYQPPPPPPQPTTESKSKSKVGPKGRKNKPMTAAEQEAKIKDLESRLSTFNNPGSAAPITHNENVDTDESSDDDDDESSGSESEEE